MSDHEHFHQQILFSEEEKTPTQADTPKSAMIFDNKDYQAHVIAAENANGKNSEAEIDDGETSWLWRSITLLVMVIAGYEVVDFLLLGFQNSPIITSLYAVLIACLTVLGLSVLIKELSGLRLLKQQQHTREQARDILAGDSKVSAAQLCEKIQQQLSYDLPANVEQKWQKGLAENYQGEELIQLYDLTVLSKVDDKALADIAKFSSEAMVLVAVSPLAIVDMLIILWRNIKMIEKISGLYGLKLGYWSRIKLLKQVFKNMIYVGASEMLVDLGSQALGADLLGKFSGRLAQGFGAGMLTARLGLHTIQVCRPLPFTEKAPRLASVRNSLLTQIKGLITKKQVD